MKSFWLAHRICDVFVRQDKNYSNGWTGNNEYPQVEEPGYELYASNI